MIAFNSILIILLIISLIVIFLISYKNEIKFPTSLFDIEEVLILENISHINYKKKEKED